MSPAAWRIPEVANVPTELLLYVAGHGPNSQLAIANLRALCERHLPGTYHLEIVDVFDAPQRALADRVLLTPMLVLPPALEGRRIVGTLSEPAVVLDALGLGGGHA